MVHGHVPPFLFIPFEQGEIYHPAEFEFLLGDKADLFRQYDPQLRQDFVDHARLVSHEEDGAAGLRFKGL